MESTKRSEERKVFLYVLIHKISPLYQKNEIMPLVDICRFSGIVYSKLNLTNQITEAMATIHQIPFELRLIPTRSNTVETDPSYATTKMYQMGHPENPEMIFRVPTPGQRITCTIPIIIDGKSITCITCRETLPSSRIEFLATAIPDKETIPIKFRLRLHPKTGGFNILTLRK